MHRTRPAFTHSNLLSRVRTEFNNVSSNIRSNNIPLADCLMSGLAIFILKYKSLLKFEEDKMSEPFVKTNLRTLYGIAKAPCDTYLRQRLDDKSLIVPIRKAFVSLLRILQRNKALENWKFLDGKFVISLDGSGFFSSTSVHCNCCLEKITNKDTTKEVTTYHHQMLVGSIVSPYMKQVLPIEFEPIIKSDGLKKNDCERNAAIRWLDSFRKAHPQLPTIMVADGLYSNAPFIKALRDKKCSFIIVAKEDDHKYLYDYFFTGEGEDICEFTKEYKDKDKDITEFYRFMSDVPLNEANSDLKVNVLHYIERDHKKAKTTKWLWVTDIEITKDNAKSIMKAGRARWKIENETFNTLKNQGYNFEHNFGHGYNGLSNVFAGLMLLAFYIDQILESCNLDFQKIIEKYKSRSNAFEKIRAKFFNFMIESFERLYEAMLGPPLVCWL